MLIDSDVFIWALKGHPKAIKLLDESDSLEISVIAYMEIIQGARGKSELQTFDKYLKRLQIKTLHINEEISKMAFQHVKTYYHSHSVELKDALIGATAVIYDLPLATANYKHLKHIEGLELQVFKPHV